MAMESIQRDWQQWADEKPCTPHSGNTNCTNNNPYCVYSDENGCTSAQIAERRRMQGLRVLSLGKSLSLICQFLDLIFCLDGGGVRGLFEVIVLIAIMKEVHKIDYPI